MSKTLIAHDSFLALVNSFEIRTEIQSGYVKCFGVGERRVYVGRGKRVGRVSIAGFRMPQGPGFEELGPDGSYGTVTQHLELCNRTADDILTSFYELLEVLTGQAPAACEVAPKRGGRATAEAGPDRAEALALAAMIIERKRSGNVEAPAAIEVEAAS